MNNAKVKFLENLYDETRIEITRQVEQAAADDFKKKLNAMVANNIITRAEAVEFATLKDIEMGNQANIRTTRTARTITPAADPCTRNVTNHGRC